jgi:hypothetical protein
VEIAGATPSGLNGEKRVLSVTATEFTFDATGISDQTASGTITAKVPGLGWTKQFTDTNKAVYLPADVAATGNRIRIDDTGAQTMRAVGYRSMTDVDTGDDPYPTTAQVSGGLYISKSSSSDGTDRAWIIIGDERFFAISTMYNGSAGKGGYFGDFISAATGDQQWDAVIHFPVTSHGTTYTHYFSASGGLPYMYMPRAYTGTGTSKPAYQKGLFSFSSASNDSTYPSPVAGGVIASTPAIILDQGSEFRGTMPGIVIFGNNCAASLTQGQLLDITGFTNKVLCLNFDTYYVGFDIGDWR